jgi:hypothetical protein
VTNIATYLFMVSNFVAVCCGWRLMIREIQYRHGPQPWDPWKRPNDPITALIVGIRLRNTRTLEIVGVAVAMPTSLLTLIYLGGLPSLH